ncbi:hypothetical protein V1460_03365 [Streptomyces sp. SCSIO 30461]
MHTIWTAPKIPLAADHGRLDRAQLLELTRKWLLRLGRAAITTTA